jgi:hypothetical protein
MRRVRDGSAALARLLDFPERLYSCMTRRADALFELCDAALTTGAVPSTVHLSLAPTHRRGWVSLYAALSKGRIDAEAMRTNQPAMPLFVFDVG